MVEHLVWFKLNEGVQAEEKQAMLETLRAFVGVIEGIQHLACGEDFSGRAHGFEIGLVVRCASREALKAYDLDPTHRQFIAQFKHLWAEVRALDFEA